MQRRSILVLVAASGLVAACGPPAGTAASCNETFARAADHVKQAANADKIDWLAELVHACGTTEQWTSAAGAYPQALLHGDPKRILRDACVQGSSLGEEPICRDLST
jgi:hypothetical protein